MTRTQLHSALFAISTMALAIAMNGAAQAADPTPKWCSGVKIVAINGGWNRPHMRALWSTPIFESLLLVGPGSSIDRMRLLSFTEAELLSRRISTANLTSGRTNVRNQYPKFGLGGVPKRAAPIWRTERVAQGLLR